MKNFNITLLATLLVMSGVNAQNQLWKRYSDSAQAFADQKNTDKAIDYYAKAKRELETDSFWTVSHIAACNNLALAYMPIRQYEKAEHVILQAKEIRERLFGKQHPEYANSNHMLGFVYWNMRQNEKAEQFYTEAKEIRERVLGKDHPDYAASCNSLGRFYYTTQQYKKAEPFWLEAKEIRERTLGKEHPEYVESCNNLGILYFRTGQYQKAEPFWTEVRLSRGKIQGKEHIDYAQSCENLASLYERTSQYVKAESLYVEARQVREKVLGKKNPEYARDCDNLGKLSRIMGKYEKAELYLTESKQIIESLWGKDHFNYAVSCNNLGILYYDMGKFSEAEPLYLIARSIYEKVDGKESRDYAGSSNNLGLLYEVTGQYEKAEPYYLEAMQIREKLFGKNHPDYAQSCDNLAILYDDMGQYEKAELLYTEALQIRERLFGEEHREYASSCNNLGVLYTSIAQYGKAEQFYLEAKRIREKVLGKEHPEYARTCSNLALLYETRREYEKAAPLLLEVLELREKAFGKEHPDYAESCFNLATLYSNMGEYQKAEPLYIEAMQIRERVFGKERYDYALTCTGLANLYRNQKKAEMANAMYRQGFISQNSQVGKIFQFTSEIEKQSYLRKIEFLNNIYFSFLSSITLAIDNQSGYDFSVYTRNLTLSSSKLLRQEMFSSPDSNIKKKYNEWMRLREQISYWQLKPLSQRPVSLSGIEAQANTLEKELTRVSADFSKSQQQSRVTWKEIRQQLKPEEAAIEFVRFNYFDGRSMTDSIYYIAFLLRKDKDEPVLIPLFESRQLEKLLGAGNTLNTVAALYGVANKSNHAFDLIWGPVEKQLEGISKIYYAPAGVLHRIAFAALPLKDHQVLSDKYRLVQLNTTADVMNQSDVPIGTNDVISLYGAIQYDVDASALKQAVTAFTSTGEQADFLNDEDTRGSSWKYLSGTEKEINGIRSIGKQKGYSLKYKEGIAATEESVKALNGKVSPAVLHVATHGFFFPDPKPLKKDNAGNLTDANGRGFKQADNPLFRSGLLFAGANNTWRGNPVKGLEDGILTAYEVSNLYLPNTNLVVLSACETGLGEIQGNEGVYGLQRAFKIAGVENLVMSLWKVPDDATAEFMQEFYRNIFNKQSIHDAFYKAQSVMKNKYRKQPYKWAAWILVR